MLALTDHDGTGGLDEASREASELGLFLVPGVEISVSWNGVTFHIVGLNIDPAHAGLQTGLSALRTFRVERAKEISRRLAKHGIEGALEGAEAFASGQIIGRSHFARFLVDQDGVVRYSEATADYRDRPDPDNLMAALKTLQN